MKTLINSSLFIGMLVTASTTMAMSSPPPAPAPSPTQPASASSSINDVINRTAATSKSNFQLSQTIYPQDSSYLSIWQGFDHEWLRFIIANKDGRIPHRVSKLDNFVDPGSDHQRVIHQFGQNTGVDGNYMHPQSRSVTIDTSGLFVRKGKLNMQWTDQVHTNDVPQANNKIRQVITVPYNGATYDNAQMFLQGIELDLVCDDSKQPTDSPCNSDGMWPYVFNIQLEQCVNGAQAMSCHVNIDIFRAWTPNFGGFQLIGEVKPLNRHLDYDLSIHFAVVAGDQQVLGNSSVVRLKNQGNIYQYDKTGETIALNGAAGHYNAGASVIKGFSFMLTPPEQLDGEWRLLGSDARQLGRYIARLRYELEAQNYRADTKKMHLNPVMEVWSPPTVVNSNLTTEMRVQLLQFGGASRQVATTPASGKLCLNSKPEAPFFSAWHKCDRQTQAAIDKFGGVERSDFSAVYSLP